MSDTIKLPVPVERVEVFRQGDRVLERIVHCPRMDEKKQPDRFQLHLTATVVTPRGPTQFTQTEAIHTGDPHAAFAQFNDVRTLAEQNLRRAIEAENKKIVTAQALPSKLERP